MFEFNIIMKTKVKKGKMSLITFVFLVSAQAHSPHSAHAAVSRHSVEELPILYPESIEDKTAADDDIPEPCRELTYCTTRPKNYPEQIFNEILKVNKPIPPMPQPSAVNDINGRNINNEDSEEEGEGGCKSQKTFDPIYKVRAERDEPWRTVIQAPKLGFNQYVRMERCLNLNANCFEFFTSVPDYVTFCHQRWSKVELLVSKANNETETITTQLPACCSCHYKLVDFFTRFWKPRK